MRMQSRISWAIGYASGVGSHSNTETIIAIFHAFLSQETWTQARLAKHVGIEVPALRKRLLELQAGWMPLEREGEHPHVYWSIPKGWIPGGVKLKAEQAIDIVRLLYRLPKSKSRDSLIKSLTPFVPGSSTSNTVATRASTEREEQHLSVVEDSAREKRALRFRYYATHSGNEGWRHASVHRVAPAPRPFFIATCHKRGRLTNFRLEGVSSAALDNAEPYRDCDPEKVDAYDRTSFRGFNSGEAPIMCEFFVRAPEARSVARNLEYGMTYEDVPGGIRVRFENAALPALATYVVGLGAAAKPLTAALESAVAELAQGALNSIASTKP